MEGKSIVGFDVGVLIVNVRLEENEDMSNHPAGRPIIHQSAEQLLVCVFQKFVQI